MSGGKSEGVRVRDVERQQGIHPSKDMELTMEERDRLGHQRLKPNFYS